MTFSEDNFYRILTNARLCIERPLWRFSGGKNGELVLSERDRKEMFDCMVEFEDMYLMLGSRFSDQFHHNPCGRRTCPNENCKSIYAYFYDDFKYCPKCGTKLEVTEYE